MQKRLTINIPPFWFIVPVFIFASSAFFFLFSYNSGYGHDALQYLVFSRSILDGIPFFTFIPSKSVGFYYFISFCLKFFPHNHWGVAGMTTLIYVLFISGTFFVVKKMFDIKTAILSILLVSLCAGFMEMNYLEPEGFVYFFALLALLSMSRALKTNRVRDWVMVGIWTALGCEFKIVAGFYGAGAVIFLLFYACFQNRNFGIKNVLISVGSICFGFVSLFALLHVPSHFLGIGDLNQVLKWTYQFHLFEYPAQPYWAGKLWTKLLWFWLLLAFAVTVSSRRQIRKTVYSETEISILIFLAVFSLLSLFRTQASHYVFPAAGFLSIYVSRVLFLAAKQSDAGQRRTLFKTAILLALIGIPASLYLYPSDFIMRITTIKKFSRERETGEKIQAVVPKGNHVLFFKNPAFLYWISERYPEIAAPYFDDRAIALLKKNPNLYSEALSDPRLSLVEFDREDLGFIDGSFLRFVSHQSGWIDEFERILKEKFSPIDLGMEGYSFWIRKGR